MKYVWNYQLATAVMFVHVSSAGLLSILGHRCGNVAPSHYLNLSYTDFSSIGPSETNFGKICIKIQSFSFTEMHLKMLFVRWWPSCSGVRALNDNHPCLCFSSPQHQMITSNDQWPLRQGWQAELISLPYPLGGFKEHLIWGVHFLICLRLRSTCDKMLKKPLIVGDLSSWFLS